MMRNVLARFKDGQRGNALAEYALVTALLSMAMLATLGLIGHQEGNKINSTATALTNQTVTP